MSTILKALQKLEEETRKGRAEAPPPSPAPPPPGRRGGRLPLIALAAAAILACGVAGWAVWLRSPETGDRTLASVEIVSEPETALPEGPADPPPGSRAATPAAAEGASEARPPQASQVHGQSPDATVVAARSNGAPTSAPPAPASRAPRPVTGAPVPVGDAPKPTTDTPFDSAASSSSTGTASSAANSPRRLSPLRPPAPASQPETPRPSPSREEPPALSLFRREPAPEANVSPGKPAAPAPENRPAADGVHAAAAAPSDSRAALPAPKTTAVRSVNAGEESRTISPAPSRPAENPVTAPEDSTAAAAHRDLPVRRAREIGLQIQALVWSPAPASRMAVINGAILHTGGSVADVTVTHIGEDYVVIRKEGELLRVDFVLQ